MRSKWIVSGALLLLALLTPLNAAAEVSLGYAFLKYPDGPSVPFLQLLGGVRHDRIEDESNTAYGGMAGAGVDFRPGGGTGIRLGVDFQLFRDEGENLESLRLSVGFVF